MSQMQPMPGAVAPYQPQQPIWQWGDQLLMHKNALLPDRCVKCNAIADGGRLKRRLNWHNPVFYLVLLAGLLPYLIVALCIQETARIEIGLCRRHRARRYMAIVLGWASVIAGTALIVLAANWENGALIVLGVLIFLGGAIAGLLAARMVTPARIEHDYVWLKGVDRSYLEMFPAAQAPEYVNAPAYPQQYPQAAYGQPMYAPGVMPQRAIPIAPPPLPPGRAM